MESRASGLVREARLSKVLFTRVGSSKGSRLSTAPAAMPMRMGLVTTPFTTAPGEATYGLPYASRSDDPNRWAGWTQPGTSVADGWYRIGYTQENTTPATATTEERNTGVVFRARFTPTGMPDYWATGETFFALGNQLFATMEDMMRWFCGPDFEILLTDGTTYRRLPFREILPLPFGPGDLAPQG